MQQQIQLPVKIKAGDLVMLRNSQWHVTQDRIVKMDALAIVISTFEDPAHTSNFKYILRTENTYHYTDNLQNEIYPAPDLQFAHNQNHHYKTN